MNNINITACICTYKRPFLKETLLSLQRQAYKMPIVLDFVVIDNDELGSAKELVESVFHNTDFSFQYAIEPEKNICLARNRSLSLAKGEWVLFMDDDETAEPDLVQNILSAALVHSAQIVIGSVKPSYPDNTPSWIKSGGLFLRPLPATGTPVNYGGTGNMLVKKAVINKLKGPFNEDFGLTGGGDTDFCCRLIKNGCKIISCQEAIVTEEVERNRVNLDYLIKRAIRGGETYVRSVTRSLSGSQVAYGIFKAVVLLVACCLLFIIHLPFGKSRSIKWLLKGFSQYGKFRAFFSKKRIEIYS